MSEETRRRAEQQGDGQPENVRELEDPSGGAALAGGDERPQDGEREARGLRARPAPSRDRDATDRRRDAEP